MDRLLAMEAFVKTVEAGNMSRAAAQLGIANASVTTLIRKLEARLGLTLLQRSTRYVRLTEEGSLYYERCRAILEQIAEAEAGPPGKERPRGVLRVDTPIALGHLVLGPAMTEFARSHPQVQVITHLNNETDNLIKRGTDVAIRMEAVESGDLVARLIYRANYILCASPAFLTARGAPATPQEIDPRHGLGFVGPQGGELKTWQFHRGAESHKVTPEGNLFFNSTDALMTAAAAGAGMIYVLDVLARSFCQRGDLVRLLPDWRTSHQTFFAVYLKTSYTPLRVRAFVDFLASQFEVEPDRAPVPIRPR